MKRITIIIFVVLTGGLASAHSTGVITGVVSDQTGGLLPGASVELRSASGGLVRHTETDRTGAFRFDGVTAGVFVLEASFPNFSRLRRAGVQVGAGSTLVLNITLGLSLAADVLVTGKRSFDLSDLAEGDNLIGVAHSATQGVISGRQIDQRPIMRAGEVLEAVPGVIISQHSGEGKANQYYLRGFNLDHGTDFATTVAGVPVNLPTHAHGHGYSDLNFLIPELVGGVQFNKGPYAAQEGDFSTAGSSHIRYVNTLDAPTVRVSGGGDGWRRALGAASPRVGRGHLLAAIEVGQNDGPWARPDDYAKLNGVIRYSLGDSRQAFSITGLGYSAEWNATDQIPRRAVADGSIARFGGVDDTLGGATARYSLSADWQRASASGLTRATIYGLRYRLNLFSNFTYFLDDPRNGDQFEQADRRYVAGGRVTHRLTSRIADRPSEFQFGVDVRHDHIGTIGLYDTIARVRQSVTREDAVRQMSVGLFAQQDLQWKPWLRTTLGLRVDRFDFDVAAGNPLNSGRQSDSLPVPRQASDIDHFYTSRLAGEAAPVDDLHFHPALPRSIRLGLHLSF